MVRKGSRHQASSAAGPPASRSTSSRGGGAPSFAQRGGQQVSRGMPSSTRGVRGGARSRSVWRRVPRKPLFEGVRTWGPHLNSVPIDGVEVTLGEWGATGAGLGVRSEHDDDDSGDPPSSLARLRMGRVSAPRLVPALDAEGSELRSPGAIVPSKVADGRESRAGTGLLDLPLEVISLIISHLDPRSILGARLSCRAIRDAVAASPRELICDVIWRQMSRSVLNSPKMDENEFCGFTLLRELANARNAACADLDGLALLAFAFVYLHDPDELFSGDLRKVYRAVWERVGDLDSTLRPGEIVRQPVPVQHALLWYYLENLEKSSSSRMERSMLWCIPCLARFYTATVQEELLSSLQRRARVTLADNLADVQRLRNAATSVKEQGWRRLVFRRNRNPTNVDVAHYRWNTAPMLELVGLWLCASPLCIPLRDKLVSILEAPLSEHGFGYWRDMFNAVGLAIRGPALPEQFQALVVDKLSACRAERNGGPDRKVFLHRATFLIVHALCQPRLTPTHHERLARRLAALLPKLHAKSVSLMAWALPSVFDHISDPGVVRVLVKSLAFALRTAARTAKRMVVELFAQPGRWHVPTLTRDEFRRRVDHMLAEPSASTSWRSAVKEAIVGSSSKELAVTNFGDLLLAANARQPKNKRPPGTGRRSERRRAEDLAAEPRPPKNRRRSNKPTMSARAAADAAAESARSHSRPPAPVLAQAPVQPAFETAWTTVASRHRR